jgi:uncharacterized membrane protein YgcG
MQKSRQSFVSFLLLLAFSATGALFFPTPTIAAPAESRCNLTVNDSAKVLTTTELSSITSTAKKLEASAANSTVRVVTVSKDSNNLEQLAYQQCGALWFSDSSTLKSNIILLMVKPFTPGKQDGKAFVAAGSSYPEIASQTQNVIATMKPQFQNKDYAGGLIAGLQYMQQLTQSNSYPPSNGGNSQEQPYGTANKPTNITPLWIILGMSVVLGALGILTFFIIQARRAKKGENEAKRVVQQDAKLIRTQAVNAVRELTDKLNDPSLQAHMEVACQVSPVNAQHLREIYQSLSTNVSNLSVDMRNITSSASNPDSERTVPEYQRICSYFAPIVREADDLQKMITRFEYQLDAVERNPQAPFGTSSRRPL